MVIGALEAGGTKMVCAIGDGTQILKRVVFPTTSPEETVPKMVDFFRQNKVERLGIGCFGPLELNRREERFGTILSTPKVLWRDFPIYQSFVKELMVPVAIDTDVNVAAYGEVMEGAGKGEEVVLYITVGTGIGVGICVKGAPIHGLIHPEAGHILIKKQEQDNGESVCPYHDSCLEGLASGPSMEKRWGKRAEELLDNSEAWNLEAYYLGQAITNFVLMYSPNRIILGGGVMHQKELYKKVREEVLTNLNGYIRSSSLLEHIDEYIVSPGLGDHSGIIGAMKLAEFS